MPPSAIQKIHRHSAESKSIPSRETRSNGPEIQSTRTSGEDPKAAQNGNTETVFSATGPKTPPPVGIRLERRSERPDLTTRSEPCPICEKSGCARWDDGALLICRRGGSERGGYRYVKPADGGAGHVFVIDGSVGLSAKVDRVDAGLSVASRWPAKARGYFEDGDADRQRRRLAAELGVSVRALEALETGWKPRAYGPGAWTIPQRDAAGSPISISLRIDREEDRQRFDSDGRSKSPAGLIFSPGQFGLAEGPVFSVEGASDVAALISVGLDAVGHGGNSVAGRLLDELGDLLATVPEDRPILAVAERDPPTEDHPLRHLDRDSPGRVGARTKAQRLATRLRRRIGVVLAPDEEKDARSWLGPRIRKSLAGGSRIDAAIRDEWLAGVLGEVEWFDPEPETPHRVEPLQQRETELELDEYRRRMRENLDRWSDGLEPVRAISPDQAREIGVDESFTKQRTDGLRGFGRIAILPAPAGVGKTTAVESIAVPKFDASVECLPTHDNVSERSRSIVELDILTDAEVAAFPKLDEDSCISFTEEQAEELRDQGHAGATSAAAAQALGFSVRSTACRTCPLAPWRARQRVEEDDDLAAWAPDVDLEESPRTCAYWDAVDKARSARHRVGTLARAAKTGKGMTSKDDGRTLIILDENVAETLAPTANVSRATLAQLSYALTGAGLRMQDDLTVRRARRLRRARSEKQLERDRELDERTGDAIELCQQLAEIAETLIGKIDDRVVAGEFGVHRVDLPIRLSDPEETGEPGPRVAIRQIVGRGSRWEPRDAAGDLFSTSEKDPPAPSEEDEETSSPPAEKKSRRRIKWAARRLAEALQRSLPRDAVVDSAGLELLRRVHAGGKKIDRLVVHVEQLDGGAGSKLPEGQRKTRLAVIGSWKTDLLGKDPHADLLLLDATVDRESLGRILGRFDIENLAPAGSVRRQSAAVQLPRDITSTTSPRVAAKALEQSLAALPGSKRVGLIMLSAIRKRLFPVDSNGNDIRTAESRELVPDDVLRRIARDADGRLLVEHFGGGRDRSSNEWIHRADGLILLGTPRPPASAVVEELVRRDEVDAAERGSAWSEVRWEALDTDGNLVRCRGRGYLDPAWASAANAKTRAGLTQALERARTALPSRESPEDDPGGIPVVVVSSEPTGLPVVARLPDAISRGARRVERILREITSRETRQATGESRQESVVSACAKNSIEHIPNTIELLAQAPDIPAKTLLDALIVGGEGREPVPLRTARRWISEAIDAGIVIRTGRTSSTRYGLPPPDPGEIPVPDAGKDSPTLLSAPPEDDLAAGEDFLRSDEPLSDWELDDVTKSSECEQKVTSDEPLTDWELDELLGTFDVRGPVPIRDPVPAFSPTGPPDGWRSWEPDHAEPYLATGPTAA